MSNHFEAIFTAHLDMLYGVAYGWTQNQQEAEDLVQDLAIKLMGEEQKLQSLERVSAWMVRVMYRMFVDRYRRAKRFTIMPCEELEPLIEQHGEPARHDHLAEEYHRQQVVAGLLEAIQGLDAPQRAALSLFEIEGYRLQEIADIQQVSIGTVKSRLFRAKESLRKSISLEPFAASARVKGKGRG